MNMAAHVCCARRRRLGNAVIADRTNVAENWATALGLAPTPFWAVDDTGRPAGQHIALLDGRRASFVCSTDLEQPVGPTQSRSWRWSADISHHVLVGSDTVEVQSGIQDVRRFTRASVEQHLGDFQRFLEEPRREELPDVVPFLMREFVDLWATLPRTADGITALAAFLVALRTVGSTDEEQYAEGTERTRIAAHLGFSPSVAQSLIELPDPTLRAAIGLRQRTPQGLDLEPSLVLRHAGGRLFQDAHGVLERHPQYSLFGDAPSASLRQGYSLSGAYFTPVPIARAIAESALSRWTRLPKSLAIADYACGSAVFLAEALRVLVRRGFDGTLRLIGRDRSPTALAMAGVALTAARRDAAQNMRIEVDLQEADAMKSPDWPMADVILINPPFKSWEAMSEEERAWTRTTIGSHARGRPDLSAGFASQALRSLRPDGVFATLLPAGVLASDGLRDWRTALWDAATPRLVGVMGDHSLFRNAVVNVGFVVFDQGAHHDRDLILAWASAESGAAAGALRALRRTLSSPPPSATRLGGWPTASESAAKFTVSRQSVQSFTKRASWLPGPGTIGALLDRLQGSVETRVADLFQVRQGIRTGAKDVFIQSRHRVLELPRGERRFFVPAVTTDAFRDGVIEPTQYMFTPPDSWQTERDVRAAIPTFFEQTLRLSSERLKRRAGIASDRWWRATRARGWMSVPRPRLVSKRFGLLPAFALDLKGEFAVVQANAWVPTKQALRRVPEESVQMLLAAYWWLLNSRVMVSLFQEFCPNVAGGQFDLEHKYVKHIPLPDLAVRLESDLREWTLRLVAEPAFVLPPLHERDAFAAAAFSTMIEDWPSIGAAPPRDVEH